jgi:hypothetical protein
MLTELPTARKSSTLQELPNRTAEWLLIRDPNRKKDRMEQLLPKCKQSRTDA